MATLPPINPAIPRCPRCRAKDVIKKGRRKTRLDRIEHLLLAEQKGEIEDLKQRMTRLEDALAV